MKNCTCLTKPFPPHSITSQVNSLLQALRGEAFRRQRNLQGGRVSAPSVAQGPSLPPLSANATEAEDEAKPVSYPKDKTAGPRPPRSWGPSTHSSSKVSPEWRSDALSLIFRHTPCPSPALYPHPAPRIPSLFQLCMHTLVYDLGGIPPEFFPLLPRHVLREYVRYCAVHAPRLPREDLDALWAVDDAASADGELVITGPFAESVLRSVSGHSRVVPHDWESDVDETESGGAPPPPPALLHTFIVLATSVQPSVVALLPPTLTHVALLDIPHIALHRLPALLPRLAHLDLSFNAWIGAHCGRLVRLQWSRWTELEMLGLRGCGIGDADGWTLRRAVNQGRVTDVEVILTD